MTGKIGVGPDLDKKPMVGSLNLPMQFKDLTEEEHKSLELVANLIKVDNEGESNSTVGSLDKEKIL